MKNNFNGEVFIKIGNDLNHDEIIEEPDYHLKNLIVNSASILIAQWAQADEELINHIPGLTYLAIGTGGFDVAQVKATPYSGTPPLGSQTQAWDPLHPPLKSGATTKLVDEINRVHLNATYPVDIHTIDFLYVFPSPAIITSTTPAPPFSEYDVILEMGLFGGINAQFTDSGTMFNYVTFSGISKPTQAELDVVWRINFLPMI